MSFNKNTQIAMYDITLKKNKTQKNNNKKKKKV